MKPSEILSAAAEKLEPFGAWTTGATARAGSPLLGNLRRVVRSTDGDATCWCLIGAVEAIGGMGKPEVWGDHGAVDYLRIVTGMSVSGWNDARGRTKAQVISALRQAAKFAEEEGQ